MGKRERLCFSCSLFRECHLSQFGITSDSSSSRSLELERNSLVRCPGRSPSQYANHDRSGLKLASWSDE
eukprot:6672689-Heterocapsa_arctica.AAC.1